MGSKLVCRPEFKSDGGKRRSLIFRRSTLLSFALILALLFVSRLALAPTYLVTFDEVNFALSIRDFNPIEHQPQPPGYPLFVALLRLFGFFIPQVEHLFLAVALFGSVLALVLVWAVGERLMSERIGLVAAMLLVLHPAFWFAALTNPVRIYLAVGASGVAFCVCKAFTSYRAVLWYYAAAFVFGIAGGFRPDLLMTLFPLMVYVAWRLRLHAGEILIALVAFLLPTSAWLAALFASVGGPAAFIVFMDSYWHQQGGTTSPLLGASIRSSLGMAYRAVVWTFAATLSWLWCVPFVMRRTRPVFTKEQKEFLLVWLVPGLLFYILIHIGDPDHPLSLIPATCLAGAVLLVKFADTFAPKWLPGIVGAAVALNLLFFMTPINRTAAAASYEAVTSLDTYMEQVIESIGALRDSGPVTAVSPQFISGWRAVSYYFPQVPLLVIESGNLRNPTGSRWYRGQRFPLPVNAGTVMLPGCGTIAWIDPDARPLSEPGGRPLVSMPGVPVTNSVATPNSSYSLRGIRFQANPRGCGQDPG